jgi:ribonuclease D
MPGPMQLITTTDDLAAFCQRQSSAQFITVDTEFMRERTYWPILCLVQVAGPEEACAIDPLAPELDLAPLLALFDDPRIVKVFHAARQDLEIFYKLSGRLPVPIFDTQVAGMVCGHGEAASYETLVSKLARAQVDKSSRFTDWARRPLTERQLQYAISDVTHLRVVYEKLAQQLERTGRTTWIAEEMAALADPAILVVRPEDAWLRIKPRHASPRMLVTLRELAAWREREAQRVDVPRGRILRDEQVMEIASHAPKAVEALSQVRGLSRGFAEGRMGEAVLAVVQAALAIPDADLPAREKPRPPINAPPAVVDLLRTLLKLRSEQAGVAPRLVASADDLDRLAGGKHEDIQALNGWRAEIFGNDALKLIDGKLALGLDRDRVRLIAV